MDRSGQSGRWFLVRVISAKDSPTTQSVDGNKLGGGASSESTSCNKLKPSKRSIRPGLSNVGSAMNKSFK